MFLSVVRIWLIYKPSLYRTLRPLGLGPLEAWIYHRLRQPKPLSGARVPEATSPEQKANVQSQTP